MANNLSQLIQSNLQRASDFAPEPVSQTEQAQRLLEARTGRETTRTGPKATSIGEAMANQQTRMGLNQIAQAGQIQAEQFRLSQEQVEQQYRQQVEQLNEEQIARQEQYQRQVEALLGELTRGTKQINVAREGAKAEQLGFQLRLSNEKYINNLREQAARDKLVSDIDFKEAIIRTTFSDELDLLGKDLDFRLMLKADDAQFQKMLANIDIETAIAIASSQSQSASAQMVVGGVVQAIQAPIKYYSEKENEAKLNAKIEAATRKEGT